MPYTSVLARRYAHGLLGVVRTGGRLPETSQELHRFLDLFTENANFREAMLNPAYSASERRELLDQVAPQLNLSSETTNFLRLLIEKRRMENIGEMVEAFDELYRQEAGIIRAEVVVAEDVSPELENRVTQVVQKISGKTPEVLVQKDPSIIGGMKIRMGNTILDASIKTKLERLREKLIEPSTAS